MRTYRKIFFGYLCYFVLAFGGSLPAAPSDSLYRVAEALDMKVLMRDGVRLSANVYRPDDPGRFPALLERTPYGNGGSGNRTGHFYASRGYAVVLQDTRGRGESEGLFDAFQSETEDGYDTQQWLAEQTWCNGRIGTIGGSYVGYTQWLPAKLAHTAVVAMFPVVTFSDLHDMVYYGGAVRIRLFTGWSLEMTAPYSAGADYVRGISPDILRHLPLLNQDRLAGWKMAFYRDWLAHPEHDRYWERTSLGDGYAKIRAAAYNIGGWFDICLDGTLKNFVAMTASGIDPEVRRKQRLMVGPWVHSLARDGQVGEMDFGSEAVVDFQKIQLDWFDYHLKGIDGEIAGEDPVKIFVMGANRWRS